MSAPTNTKSLLEKYKLHFEYQEDDLVFENLIKRIKAKRRAKALKKSNENAG